MLDRYCAIRANVVSFEFDKCRGIDRGLTVGHIVRSNIVTGLTAAWLAAGKSIDFDLQWNCRQIKTPFAEEEDEESGDTEQSGNDAHELFIGSLFWSSPIFLLMAIHGTVTLHYTDRLPIIACFPAIEILLMQAAFGSVTTAAAVVLNPKDPIPWGYTVAAAVVMAAAVVWTGFVVVVLWTQCGRDYTHCSYSEIIDSEESQPDEEGMVGGGEWKENLNSLQELETVCAFPEEAASTVSPGTLCKVPVMELVMTKPDINAADEEMSKLKSLFMDAVVLPEIESDEMSQEPELFKLETTFEDAGSESEAVLTDSDEEKEPVEAQDSGLEAGYTCVSCWKEGGWGARGVWRGGTLQVKGERHFEQMLVTCLCDLSALFV